MFDTVKGCIKIGFGLAIGFSLERLTEDVLTGLAKHKVEKIKSMEPKADTNDAEEESAE